MIYVLIPALVILMGLTLYSLLRGLNAFRQTLDASDPAALKALQMKQNQNAKAAIATMVGRTIASMIPSESIRIVFSAAAIGP